MTKTNSLYDYAELNNIAIIDAEIPSDVLRGLYFDNTIVLDTRIDTTAELRCVLAEEIGHYETSTGHILDQTSVPAIKQELNAHRRAHEKLISFDQLIESFEIGCRNRHEIADHLGVTEKFLEEAVDQYKMIYGSYKVFDGYVLYFDPLGIMKML